MTFEVGETVVYPHHGAAVIEDVSTRMLKGEEKLYLTLRVAQGDLTIQVPAENCEMVGVRDVVDQKGLKEVHQVLMDKIPKNLPTGRAGTRRTSKRLPPATLCVWLK